MAEDIGSGRIVVEEPMTPILISSANIIQVPILEETHRVIVYVSKHGIKEETWLRFTDNSLISLSPPFFIMCNRKITLPAMEA